jgi:ubiquinone biosynthesis protein
MKKRFDPAEVTRATSRVAWDVLSILRRAPGQVRGLLRRLSTTGWELHVRHENIDRLVRELDRSSNRLAFSVVIGAIIIGSSVVFSANTQMALFGIKIQYFGVVGYLVAGILGLGLAWAIFRSGRLH